MASRSTLHAATKAGALDVAGREALRRYVLGPPLAQERLERQPELSVPRSSAGAGSKRGAEPRRPSVARARNRHLEPALAGVSSDTPIGGEAQRLIGQHLPGLVNTYNGLPPPERQKGSDADRILADRLDVVADELDHLCERVGCEKRARFDTETRFIETRYREGGLSLDKG